METNEHVVTLQPSQWINAGWFILPVVAGVIYLPLGGLALIAAIYKYFEVSTWSYNLNMRTIEEKKGVFSVSTQEIQYFRIKSIMVDEPLWMRIFGLAIVRVVSSEQYKPNLVLYAISNGDYVKNLLSEHAYEWRKELGIRDYDIFNS
jgi:membrane protein YdbS with pleckstrin-like domain